MWSIHLFVFSKSSKKVLFLFFVVVLLFLFPNHQLSSQETTNGLCIYELTAFYFKDSMYKRSSFQVWLVSLSIMHSRSSHIVRNGQDFTFYGWINTLVSVCVCVCVCVSVYHYFFIKLPIDWHRLLPCLGYCKQYCNKH